MIRFLTFCLSSYHAIALKLHLRRDPPPLAELSVSELRTRSKTVIRELGQIRARMEELDDEKSQIEQYLRNYDSEEIELTEKMRDDQLKILPGRVASLVLARRRLERKISQAWAERCEQQEISVELQDALRYHRGRLKHDFDLQNRNPDDLLITEWLIPHHDAARIGLT